MYWQNQRWTGYRAFQKIEIPEKIWRVFVSLHKSQNKIRQGWIWKSGWGNSGKIHVWPIHPSDHILCFLYWTGVGGGSWRICWIIPRVVCLPPFSCLQYFRTIYIAQRIRNESNSNYFNITCLHLKCLHMSFVIGWHCMALWNSNDHWTIKLYTVVFICS